MTNNGKLTKTVTIQALGIGVEGQTPAIEMSVGMASYELVRMRAKVADSGQVRAIVKAQLKRMDGTFRKLK